MHFQARWRRVRFAMKPCESWGLSSVRSTMQESWTASPCTCKYIFSKLCTLSPRLDTSDKLYYVCIEMCAYGRYGVVLRKLDLLKEAVEVFVEAIHALPLHWGAWLELSNLVTNIEMVTTACFYTFLDIKHIILSLISYAHSVSNHLQPEIHPQNH